MPVVSFGVYVLSTFLLSLNLASDRKYKADLMIDTPSCFNTYGFNCFIGPMFSGAVRLPDTSKKLAALKQVERKPLESVVRYLGK